MTFPCRDQAALCAGTARESGPIPRRLMSIEPTKSTVRAGSVQKGRTQDAKERGQEAMSFGIGPV
jgi:hypothetical protein